MKRFIWPVVIGASSLLYALMIAMDLESPLRVALVFWFMLVCPGMAYIRLLHLKEALFEWVLAVALSLTIGTLLAEAAVVNRWWSPQVIGLLLAGLSAFGAILQVRLALRRPGQKQVLL